MTVTTLLSVLLLALYDADRIVVTGELARGRCAGTTTRPATPEATATTGRLPAACRGLRGRGRGAGVALGQGARARGRPARVGAGMDNLHGASRRMVLAP